jgi:hypothetical protein
MITLYLIIMTIFFSLTNLGFYIWVSPDPTSLATGVLNGLAGLMLVMADHD